MKHICKIYRPVRFGMAFATLLAYFALTLNLSALDGFYISPGTKVNFTPNTTVYIGNDLTIGTGAYLTQQSNGIVYLSGNFSNNSGIFSTVATFIMNGTTNQAIGGTTSSEFHILSVNKTNGQIEMNFPTRINNSLRLISNSIFDLNSSDLTLAPIAKVFSDDGTTETINSFSSTKSIVNSGSGTDPLLGASLIREILPGSTLPLDLLFPISTPGTYSSVKITLLSGGATLGTNPQVKVKPVPLEHPKVETINASQKKYYVVKSQDVTVNPQGISIMGYPDAADGNNFGNYLPMVFAPNYNDPTGYWRINPGVTNSVNINSPYNWSSNQSSILNGDWLLGERRAGEATYYARANGDWNDPNTWSKVDFNGAASTTAPNKRSDKVRIQDHIVTISGAIADASLISVETGTGGRTSGILKISGENVCKGDTFKIESGARLFVAHTAGLSDATGTTGAIQMLSRSFNSNAIYHFWEGQNQITGVGLPTGCKTIIVDKISGSTVSLSQNTTISDSLLIVEGVLDLASSSLNGQSANRTLQMLGGELIVRSNFPTNYAPPTFNFGQVTFDGISSVIPSSGSSPAVLQYNQLFIKGTRSSNITLESVGEVKIIGNLDISALTFVNNTFGFIASASTVRFAKNTGNQNINFTPLSPIDDACNLKFYKLILDSVGTKTITGSNPATLKILNDLTIRNSANFVSNNFDIEVQGNWINQTGAKFTPTVGKSVTMNSVLPAPTEITITSRDTTDNSFQNLKIMGPGVVRPTDNLKILGNITLESGSNFKVTGTNIYIFGNWTNNGGIANQTNSTAYFQGNTTQSIINTTDADEIFDNLVLRNPSHLNTNGIGPNQNWGLRIKDNLDLVFGRINARNRYVQVDSIITRTGGGYINSRLRRNIEKVSNSERFFEVGYENSYTPVSIRFLQNAIEISGYLQAFADTVTTNTDPVKWSDLVPNSILPIGSKINPSKHIPRQWTVEKPMNSTLITKSNAKFTLTPRFIGGIFPNGDLRNGTNVNLMDGSLHNPQPLNTWIFPRYYNPQEPEVDMRAADSIRYGKLEHFGTIIVGEPATLTFFSRASGNWNVANNWSLVYFNGPPATEFPGQSTSNYIATIGFGHEIALESNKIVNDNGTLDGSVEIDSSGVLNFRTFNISGTGEFHMHKYSKVRLQDPNGITASSMTGNVQTATRNYNYLSHNRAIFSYERNNGPQNTGDGLPSGADSVSVIIVADTNSTLTVNTLGTINIVDSLLIRKGTLNSGNNNITLAGDLKIDAGSVYTHNNRDFSFTGIRDSQFVTAPGDLAFYNLRMSKNKNFSWVKFLPTAAGTSYNIQVANQLNFEANNLAHIDLSPTYTIDNEPNYNNGEWFMTIGTPAVPATVIRTNIGHVVGELRKNIPSGSIDGDGIQFEIGNGPLYKPFTFDFDGTGGTAGYIGAQSVPYLHKYAYYLDNVDFNLPSDRMMENYWRVTKPSGSTFSRNNNQDMNLEVGYANPQDIPSGASIFCFDLAYWRGQNVSDWQRLSTEKGNGQNPPDGNDGTPELCIDRKIATNQAKYAPMATDTSTRAELLINASLGTASLANRTLLADVIIGQQGPRLQHFYTRQSGLWTDPNTWSTASYNGIADTTFPKEKLHVVHIGEGHKVTLNANIGNGINLEKNDGTQQYYEQRLGMLEVEKTVGGAGHLDLSTFVIRSSGFQLKSGGILETGFVDGFHSAENRGNIIQENVYIPIARDFNYENHNNGNFIFKPSGIITTTYVNPDYVYCNISDAHDRKARVASLGAAKGNSYTPPNIIAHYYATESDTKGFIYIPFNVYWLKAGEEYTFRIFGGVSGNNKCSNMKAYLFMDLNFDGDYTDLGEQLLDEGGFDDENCYHDVSFVLPDTLPQGTTQLRVIAANGNVDDPCDQFGLGQSGGSVDFTVHIENPNFSAIHYTGSAVPAQIASLTINADSCGQYVEQNSPISVKDSILLKAGQFSTSTQDLKLQGDLVNNSGLEGLRADIGGIEFNGISNQQIRGTSGTKMWNTILNNTGNSIILKQELTNRNLMTFQQDCKLDIEEQNLYFDTTAQMISSGSGSFSKNRMITSLGTTSSHITTKYFPSTFGGSSFKEFLFPIGYSTNYNPVYMNDTISAFALKPTFSTKIVGEKHPQLPPPSVHYLNIYWPVTSTGFNNIDELKFYYQPADVQGDSLKFIPAIYTNGYWRYDVGESPSASPSPITITNTRRINGDWTVIDSTIKTYGTIYFSRLSGEWTNPANWSTDQVLQHNGPPTSFYPGQLFSSDTVNIDGHNIIFNPLEVQIDSLRIGGTNSVPEIGKLTFGSNINNKELRTRVLFLDDDNGIIDVNLGGNLVDNLGIYEKLINDSQGGINSEDGVTHTLSFRYIGDTDSEINGTGLWQNVSGIMVSKVDGFADSVHINSENFSNATVASANPKFTLNNGVLISNSGVPTKLSGETHTVEIKSFAGLIAENGDFQTSSNLRNYPSSLIKIDGSDIYVGNHTDENYIFDTGTDFQLLDGKFIVGGAFIPQNDASQLNLSVNSSGEITAGKFGYTGTRATFDMSNPSSAISMTGGRIILANGNTNAVSNLTINAANPIGTGITGGVIQIGDSALTTSTPTTFRIGGTTPFYNLHLVGNSTQSTIYTTSLATSRLIVKNQILINDKQILDINGKTLELQGDLLSYGKLAGTPATATSDPWQIQLTGGSTQYLKNFNPAENDFEVYNVSMDKTAGNLILGGSDAGIQFSSLKVNEVLDFTATNQSLIDAQTYSNKVILGPNASSIGQYQVIRSGLGHVFGTMSGFIDGSKSINFAIGADTLESYRPVEIEVSGSTNTNGYLDVTPYNVIHPNVASSKLIPAMTVPRYWSVNPTATGGFQLGTDGKYSITTNYLNPGDIPAGSDPNNYEHSNGIAPFNNPSLWFSPIFVSLTATSVKSRDLVDWGDFIVGNPTITNFYSIANGPWNDANSWSKIGYAGPPADRYPDKPNDFAHIGNGRIITVNVSVTPAIKSVVVEVFAGLPGILQINGAATYISSADFTLNDDCTLGTQNTFGIDAAGITGAVRTTLPPVFGNSHYIYNSNSGNQITGTGLPKDVLSLTITNSSPGVDKTVTISNSGTDPINVKELLSIEQGVLNSGNRNLRLLGDFVLDDMTNDGLFQPQAAKVTFDGLLAPNNVTMKNKAGLTTWDVELAGGNVLVSRSGPGVTPATHHYIQNNLNFLAAGKIILGDATNLIVSNPNANAITNYGNDKFIQTSLTSGMLIRSVNSIGNYIYPIGSNESSTDHYTPLNLDISSVTTAGQLGARVSPGTNPGPPAGGHLYIRTAVTSEYLKRYWMIDAVSGDFAGTGRFYYTDDDIFGTEANYNRIGRWRPQNEGSPGSWVEWSNPPTDFASNYFETFGNFNSSEFTGDWTLGNPFAFRRIFFSRQTGNWNDPNSWTESPTHSGVIFGAGLWPDAPTDSVQIGEFGGNPHEISLTNPTVSRGLTLGTALTNRGILNTNNQIVQGEYFTMGDLSHLKITSTDGITALGSATGSIQSTLSRTFSSNGIYEYSGTANQAAGNGLPATLNTLIINNSGAVGNNIVSLDKNIGIAKDLTITRGALDLGTFTANNTSTGNFTNSSLGRLIIGGSNTMLSAVNNYSSYSIDEDSYTEFNGILNQNIYEMPANLDLDSGLGNVDLNGGGTKYANQYNLKQMMIRGNLRNFSPARLEIMPVDNTIWILKDIINQSHIKNEGVIDLGEKGN